jgi:hypothetical protein
LQKRSGVILWLIDTEQTKDLLNRLIHDPDPKQWEVHNAIADDYCQQLSSEEKVQQEAPPDQVGNEDVEHAEPPARL